MVNKIKGAEGVLRYRVDLDITYRYFTKVYATTEDDAIDMVKNRIRSTVEVDEAERGYLNLVDVAVHEVQVVGRLHHG